MSSPSKKYPIPARFIPSKKLSAPVSRINPFSLNDLLVCAHPNTAGFSNYPVFGKITKITPTGKFRITLLAVDNVESVLNLRGQWGSKQVIKPAGSFLDKTVLASWEFDQDVEQHLYAGKNEPYQFWTYYKPETVYVAEFNNGD